MPKREERRPRKPRPWLQQLQPLPLSFPATAQVHRVIERLTTDPRVGVRRSGRLLALVERNVVEHAIELGLGHLRIGELITQRIPRVSDDATLTSARRAAQSDPAPFLAVDSGAKTIGILPTASLTIPAKTNAGWGPRGFERRLARVAGPQTVRRVQQVVEQARQLRLGLRLVGGLVRDLILGCPNRDLDFVTGGDPARLARRMAQAWGGSLRYHREFRTVVVALDNGDHVDFAAVRDETYDAPAALPRVERGDWDADLRRRDFTFNALAVGLTGDTAYGELIDATGGLADLRSRRIRVFHGMSFIDDPTRALRCARFAARFDFAASEPTARLIRVAQRERVFEALSATRLRREVYRLLAEAKGAAAVRAGAELDLWEVLHPRLRRLAPAALPALRRLDRLVERFGSQLSQALLRLGVLTYKLEASEVDELDDRLQLDRDSRRELSDWADRIPGMLAQLNRRRSLAAVTVHRACGSLSADGLLVLAAVASKPTVRRAVAIYIARRQQRHLTIRGGDLRDAGLSGPAIGLGLEAAYEALIAGRARTRRQQLDVALRAGRRA